MKKYCKIIIPIVILIFFFLFIPFIISISYTIGNTKPLIYFEFLPGEILTFYGAILSCLGTVVLGYVAFRQNETINKVNDKLMKLQSQQYVPYFDIKAIKFEIVERDINDIPNRENRGSREQVYYYDEIIENKSVRISGTEIYLLYNKIESPCYIATIRLDFEYLSDSIIHHLDSGVLNVTYANHEGAIEHKDIKISITNAGFIKKYDKIGFEFTIFYDHDLNKKIALIMCFPLKMKIRIHTLMGIDFECSINGELFNPPNQPLFFKIESYDAQLVDKVIVDEEYKIHNRGFYA